MHILEHHQRRLPRRQPFDLRHQRLQCFLLLILRGEVEPRVALGGRQRQQSREQWGGLAEIARRLGEHRLELVEPLIGGVIAPEPGSPFELGDRRV
jgi:hypothetical protein